MSQFKIGDKVKLTDPAQKQAIQELWDISVDTAVVIEITSLNDVVVKLDCDEHKIAQCSPKNLILINF